MKSMINMRNGHNQISLLGAFCVALLCVGLPHLAAGQTVLVPNGAVVTPEQQKLVQIQFKKFGECMQPVAPKGSPKDAENFLDEMHKSGVSDEARSMAIEIRTKECNVAADLKIEKQPVVFHQLSRSALELMQKARVTQLAALKYQAKKSKRPAPRLSDEDRAAVKAFLNSVSDTYSMREFDKLSPELVRGRLNTLNANIVKLSRVDKADDPAQGQAARN